MSAAPYGTCVCGKRLSRGNSSGQCKPCFAARRRGTGRTDFGTCDCGTRLARGNTSGKCKPCFLVQINAGLTPERRGAIMRHLMMINPIVKKSHVDRLRAYTQTAEFREQSRARMLADPKHAQANAAAGGRGAEPRMRAGRTTSARRLSHIPEDARGSYMAMRRKGVPRDLAEQAALDELEIKLARFREKIGASCNAPSSPEGVR